MADLKAILEAFEAAAYRKKFFAMDFYEPYSKQAEFLAAGAIYKERLFSAGNQLGKSLTGAFETACHLTGRYPTWWAGRRFDHPTRGWAGGVSAGAVRDINQGKLLGRAGVGEDRGTGMVPKDLILGASMLTRPSNSIDTLQVRHVSGGVSTLKFLSYEQGREKFQGEPIDFAWLDEEAPKDVYSEVFARTTATRGIIFTTFTPLNGRTELYTSFEAGGVGKYMITMRASDAPHMTEEMIAAMLAGYPSYQHGTRINGVPMAGEGRVFKISEEAIKEATIEAVPAHWRKLWGIDFGVAHPFAAVLIAWDVDLDVIHVLHANKVSDQGPMQHAALIRPRGPVPVAWPHDGNNREKGSLRPLADLYRKEGLKMLATHSTFPDGSMSTEAGIVEMEERMTKGKFKVAAHLSDWFTEFLNYHRKDGLLVRVADDLMSATRIAVMAKRYAQAIPLAGGLNQNYSTTGFTGQLRKADIARGADMDCPFDLYGRNEFD